MNEPNHAREDGLPLSDVRRIDLACDAFEAAWRDDKRPRLEEFLGSASATERGELLRQLLLVELEQRGERGEEPLPDEYAARFPDDAELLEEVFRDQAPS